MPRNKKKKTPTLKYLGEMCLHQRAAEIGEVTTGIRAFALAMLELMSKHDGVGLAGPQAGISLRLVAFNVPRPEDPAAPLSPGERELLPLMPLILVNPVIESFSPVTAAQEEGCLSVPGVFAPVERPVSVTLRARALDGHEVKADCGGLLGRAIQHELDHLDGILFVQRLKDDAFAAVLPQLRKIIKKYGSRKYKINRLV